MCSSDGVQIPQAGGVERSERSEAEDSFRVREGVQLSGNPVGRDGIVENCGSDRGEGRCSN